MLFTDREQAFYSDKQKEILQFKKDHTYTELMQQYGFSSRTTLRHFLERTILGFRLYDIGLVKSGPIPLVPDIVTEEFKTLCINNAKELNCLYTYKAISYLEQALSERLLRVYEICMDLTLPFIYDNIETRFHDTEFTNQWFNHYCDKLGFKLLNSQNLQHLRRKFCHTNVMVQFYAMLQNTIHQVPELLFNADETSFSSNKKGKLVVPDNTSPLVDDEELVYGHITTVCTCRASGHAFQPFIILKS